MHMPVPGGLFVLSMLVAWRWEGFGGALLVLEGIVALALMVRGFVSREFKSSNLILMCLTLVLPLLAAGNLI